MDEQNHPIRREVILMSAVGQRLSGKSVDDKKDSVDKMTLA